jgi:hypothetical protein
MAAWVVQHRPEVARVALLSPFLSPKGYPVMIIRPLSRAMLLAPNFFMWWDSDLKDAAPGPRYGYPRYPSHAMAQIMRLSDAVRAHAQQYPPQSSAILAIINEGPRESIDNEVYRQLLATWQSYPDAYVTTFALDGSLDLEHNYIDPDAPKQFVNLAQEVHPLIVEQIDQLARPQQQAASLDW